MSEERISFDLYHPHPLMVVISGPSGVGKDAVIQELKSRHLPFHFVVTTTSRSKRPNEVEGKDYFFVTREQFEKLIADNELIEYARVYEDYKGVPAYQVRQALESGKDVLMRVDVQGAARIRALFPQAVLIFLVPANEEEWLKRLVQRNTENEITLKIRVNAAREELKKLDLFDYIVVNEEDCLAQAADTIESIIRAEHHHNPPRQVLI